MNRATEEKKGSRKKALVVFGVVVIAAIITLAIVVLQYQPNNTPASTTSSPYVEVDYKTVGWFYGYGNNYTYLLLNVSIIDHGYSQVNVQGISLSGGFSVTIDNVIFPQIYMAAMNVSNTYTLMTSTLSDVTLLNTGKTSGTIIFQFKTSPQIYNTPFVLSYVVTYGTNYQTATVRIYPK